MRFRLFRTLCLLALSCAALTLTACNRGVESEAATTPVAPKVAKSGDVDEHSYAEPDKVVIDDLALDIALDFDAKTIAGTATYTLDWKDQTGTQLVLDTRDLAIEKVEGEASGGWQPLKFALAEADPVLYHGPGKFDPAVGEGYKTNIGRLA